jgi:DNA repair exonuclease SbcCD nuclease subunit
MTKIAIVADCHIHNFPAFGGHSTSGINSRCAITLDTLDLAYETAMDNECKLFLVAGDLFDTSKPTPQVITAVQEIFSPKLHNGLLIGTHDPFSFANGDHALGPLQDRCTIYDKPNIVTVDKSSFLVIPVQEGDATSYIKESLKTLYKDHAEILANADKKIIVMHAGIPDGASPVYLKGPDTISISSLVELCKEYKIDFVFSGHWHTRMVWKEIDSVKIVQIGALCPTGFDNPGFKGYGTLIIYDTESNSYSLFEIPGPRFAMINSPKGYATDEFAALNEATKLQKEAGNKVFLRATVLPDHVSETLKHAAASEVFSDVEVFADKDVISKVARKAATAAKSAKTLEESLTAFIKEMPLLETVNRDNVLARTKKYLGIV